MLGCYEGLTDHVPQEVSIVIPPTTMWQQRQIHAGAVGFRQYKSIIMSKIYMSSQLQTHMSALHTILAVKHISTPSPISPTNSLHNIYITYFELFPRDRSVS